MFTSTLIDKIRPLKAVGSRRTDHKQSHIVILVKNRVDSSNKHLDLM